MFTIIYKNKKKTLNNIEDAIALAKRLPEGACKIVYADNPIKVVWERAR
jgi:hypothetical protein